MNQKAFQTGKAERLSYGGFFLGQNIIYVLQFQFLAYFLTEAVGLKASDAALLLLLTRLFDAANDPVIGALVDKMNFKGGKYLPWLRVATLTIPVSLILVFSSIPGASYGFRLFYGYMTMCVFSIMYTIADSPIFSLGTVMTNNTYERDVLLSYGRFAAAFAAITSAVFFTVKSAVNGNYTIAITIYCFAAFLCMLPMNFLAKERIKFERKPLALGQIFKLLIKNKYLLIYFAGYLGMYALNTLQTMAAYFANYNLGDENMVTVIMGVSIVPVLLVAPFLPKLIQVFGKRRLTMYCCAATIALSVLQYLCGYQNLPLFLAVSAVRVVFMQVPMLIYGMFTADCIEYGASVTGERAEGVSFAVQTFVTKLGGSICGALCLALMSAAGYITPQPNQTVTQPSGALDVIWLLISLLPVAGYAVMWIVMKFFYKLEEADIEKIKAGEKLDLQS